MEVSLKYLVSASRALGRELLIDEGFAHPPVRNALLYPWLWYLNRRTQRAVATACCPRSLDQLVQPGRVPDARS